MSNQALFDIMTLTMTSIENLFLKPASPLHEIFNLAERALTTEPLNYNKIFNDTPVFTQFFEDLRGEVKKNHKATRRFDETLNLLRNSTAYQEFDESSIIFFGDIQPQVRHVLYLLSWGFNNSYNNNGDKTMIFKVINTNKQQLSSLAKKLYKPTGKISISELTNAIMNGDFDQSFLKKATPLQGL